MKTTKTSVFQYIIIILLVLMAYELLSSYVMWAVTYSGVR